MKDLQQKVDSWIKQVGGGYFTELTNLGILTEEVGEMAHWIVRKYGDQTPKPDEKDINMDEAIADELADIIWVLMCLANQMGIDIEKEMEKNIQKKTSRDAERHIRNKRQ